MLQGGTNLLGPQRLHIEFHGLPARGFSGQARVHSHADSWHTTVQRGYIASIRVVDPKVPDLHQLLMSSA